MARLTGHHALVCVHLPTTGAEVKPFPPRAEHASTSAIMMHSGKVAIPHPPSVVVVINNTAAVFVERPGFLTSTPYDSCCTLHSHLRGVRKHA